MTLSPREREVMVLVGRDGLSYRDVAERMGLHEGTVRTYVNRIMRKSGMSRRAREAMVVLYMRENHVIGSAYND